MTQAADTLNERYVVFLECGGGKGYEYMAFIAEMKRRYGELHPERLMSGKTIINHEDFTKFIRGTALTLEWY